MGADGNELLQVLDALANPHRLRIIAALQANRMYVSELARAVQLSRPLLYLHLKKLEDAGLVKSHLELSAQGKAMKFYELVKFELHATPEIIHEAVKSLTIKHPLQSHTDEEEI